MPLLQDILDACKDPDKFVKEQERKQREAEARAKERERELAENWRFRWKEYAKEAWLWVKFLFVIGLASFVVVAIAAALSY